MEPRTRQAHPARTRRRAAALIVFAVTPSAALAWIGCSSSSSNGGTGRVTVDPGGTFGAEVSVTVVGRGRVTSTLPGLDCPADCTSKLVFADRTQPGATGGLTLKAIATPGVRFGGWKFETASLGTRGRGPEACNPVKRDTVSPSVDVNAAEITLPYGEATGVAPAGQEATCSGFTTVPVAYNVTATFVDQAIIDAGFDAEAGADVFLESPVAGAIAKEIGIAGGRLYWRYTSGGQSSIATAPTSGGIAETIPGTTGFINPIEFGQHVVWQASGNIGVIQGGSTFATNFSGGGNTCVAMESDFSNVFCRTAGPAGSMISWSTAGTSMTTLHTGLPVGTEFTVDSSGFAIVDTTSGFGLSTIRSISRTATPDAGTPTFGDLVTGLSNPTQLEASGTSRLFWIADDGAGVAQSAARFGGTAFSSTPATSGLKLLATDPQSTSSFFVGIAPSTSPGASSIVRLSAFSTTTTPVRSGLTGLGGIVADSSYVYWTQSDGRVYRAQRSGF
jgi:hypothetical protein